MTSAVEPVAIVSMAIRAPGARDVEEFWDNLIEGRDSIQELTDEQLIAAGEDPSVLAEPDYVRACPLVPDVDGFDARFFGVTPREAELRDPQHRMFLELCHTALVTAGYDPGRYPGAIGVYAGQTTNRYAEQNLRSDPELAAKVGSLTMDITNHSDYLTTFVSYKLGLRGPSLSLATACSTSLVAVHLAAQALRAGECDMALAGGVEVEMPYGRGYRYVEGGIYSADGRCRPFDEGATGTVFGNGGGVLLLKRLTDAQADGDEIVAVIRGSAINNDGSGKVGFTAPSVEGQAACVAEAYAVAGIDPARVGYIEAHGTATPLGDPVEVTALTQAFRLVSGTEMQPGTCLIGSVKSNIGHLGPASGVAGLIKSALALRRGQIPATINFTSPNPRLRLAETPFAVAAELTAWRRHDATERYAGVSSFGIGGTNAHIVLAEAPATETPVVIAGPELLVWSARDAEDEAVFRGELAARMPHWADRPLADVAFTLRSGRAGQRFRAAIVASDIRDAGLLLAGEAPRGLYTSDGTPRLRVLAFPGQGAQHPGMALTLREQEPGFAARLDDLLSAFSDELGVDIAAILREGPAEKLARTEYAQPALFAVEYALALTLLEYGAAPDLLIGHSLGELTAAAVAGVFSEQDVVKVVAARARVMQAAPGGAMLVVAAAEPELIPYLGRHVSVSVVNSARQIVVGGREEAVTELEGRLREARIPAKRLGVSHAFHTPMMADAAVEFASTLRGLTLAAPTIPIVSAATGDLMTDEQARDPDFWAGQLTSAVRFRDAAGPVLIEPSLVVETGPGDTLVRLLRAEDTERGHVFASALGRHADGERKLFLGTLGALFVHGAALDWDRLPAAGRRRVTLPGYPYRRTRYWIDPPAARSAERVRSRPEETPAQTPIEAGQPRMSVPSWTQDRLIASGSYTEPGERGTALALLPEDRRAAATVTAALRASGYQVIGVRAGVTPEIRAAEPRIRPGNRADLQELLDVLEHDDRAPALVVHAWCAGKFAQPEVQVSEEEVTNGFRTVFALCQALVRRRCELAVITSGGVDVSGAEPLHPARAMLTGLVRTAALESPAMRPRLIDIAKGVSGEILGSELADDSAGDGAQVVCALRAQRRWVPTWRDTDLSGTRPELLRRRGVYVITGGFGALGLATAHGVAATGLLPKLVLLGRGGPGSVDPGVLAALEEQGAEVLPLAADVTDAESLAAALERVRARFGTVNGVFHTAGLAGGGLLALRTPEAAEAVLRPKLHGSANLLRLLREEPQLDFILLYSSRAAVSGLVGSGDYAAANAYLDALAQGAHNTSVISVDWPAWSGAGMAERSESFAVARTGGGARSHEFTLDPVHDWVVAEHRVGGRSVLPGTGHIDAIVSAARATGVAAPEAPLEIENLVFSQPLVADRTTEVRVEFTPADDATKVRLLARPQGAPRWTEHSRALLRPATATRRDADVRELLARPVTGGDVPSRAQGGLVWMGPRWGGTLDVRGSGEERIAALELAPEFVADLRGHPLHPALLDRATGLVNSDVSGGHLPFLYERLVVFGDLPAKVVVRAANLIQDGRLIGGDVDVYDTGGRQLLAVRGFRMLAAGQETPRDTAAPAEPADALSPEEGVRQLLRILSGRITGQIAVAPKGARPATDGRAAPAVAKDSRRQQPPAARPAPSEEADDITTVLTELWAEALGVPELDPDDDFFELGGDSLAAVQLIDRIRDRLGVNLSIGSMFESPTVGLMAKQVTR